VNEWNSSAEPTLADVQAEFSGWEAWRGISGLYYARQAGRTGQPRVQAEGEDPRDLRDSIVRWLALHEEEDRAREAGS
jgi:hypothetical protein